MLTYDQMILRFPAMSDLDPARFDLIQGDTVLIMGNDDGRWLNFYDVAQASLIAHLVTIGGSTGDESDSGMSAAPVTRTDVDDVQVEFADRIWAKVPYQEADLYSTSYGQAYVRWRRMAFAGPRFA